MTTIKARGEANGMEAIRILRDRLCLGLREAADVVAVARSGRGFSSRLWSAEDMLEIACALERAGFAVEIETDGGAA